MRVSFDSHILGKVIFPERREKDPDHEYLEQISTALKDGRLQGFLCESIAILEAIAKNKRAHYFANRIPKSEVKTHSDGNHPAVTITIRTDHDRHPGLHEALAEKLERAQILAMRILHIPALNLQIPKYLRDRPQFYASHLFETQLYADRFWEITDGIEARGAGGAVIKTLIQRFAARLPETVTVSRSGMQLLEYAKNEAEETLISKAIAEWADGDLVAAHIASGNEFLCSEDRGRSASGPAVFDDCNRAWLKETYGVAILSARELAAQVVEIPVKLRSGDR
jgi:hypothetical protein